MGRHQRPTSVWERLPWFWHRWFDATLWCRCSRSRSLASAEQTYYLPKHVELESREEVESR